jgi:hypothetical protein
MEMKMKNPYLNTGWLSFRCVLPAFLLVLHATGLLAQEAKTRDQDAFVSSFPCLDVPVPEAAPVDEYQIHEDGGLVYDPLFREALKTGTLVRPEPGNRQRASLDAGAGMTVSLDAPRRVPAYSVAEIPYRIQWGAGGAEAPSFPLAIEAVAFEDPKRRDGRDLFDLALPGQIDLDVEFMGSITAHLTPGARHNLRADMLDEPGHYPGFERREQVRSGVIEAGDLVWFQFQVTNTGNTIFKPEGFGGCQFFPILKKRDAEGRWVDAGGAYNLYVRDTDYLYPGESRTYWVHCTGSYPGYSGSGASETPQGFGLTPGEYRFLFRMTYRCYETDDPFLNIWEGPIGFVWEMPFLVEAAPRQVDPFEGRKLDLGQNETDHITRFIHTFEEFMTAFDCHLKAPERGDAVEGKLHVQLAPWTQEIVLKLVTSDPLEVRTVALPLEIDRSSLDLAFDPDPDLFHVRDGYWRPVIASQSMADMRTNVQIGPFPERHIRARLREMMECGINTVATTSMPWLYDDRTSPESNYQGDAFKYFLDLARAEGLEVFGWGTYPFDRATVLPIAQWISGKAFAARSFTHGGAMVGMCEPNLPLANAVLWDYQARRWGDLYFQSARGEVPIDVEDTRGWMRQDIHIRYPAGEETVRVFQAWLRKKYQGLDALNDCWGTAYHDWSEIQPEAGQSANQFGHRWEYTNPDHAFHDWSKPVLDWDVFRTELRLQNYADTLAEFRKSVPGAVINVRTEGGNVLVSGLSPVSANAHFRHIYYSQRRCALMAEVVQARPGLIRLHSDYTTVPYTPSEIRFLTRTGVQQGVIPCYFPQFDNMRDIAINARYGTEYQVHYNLPEPRKGYMMHVLHAVYPWFKAVYEEGGIPGILWEDYQCDGFATVTQKREMRLFHEKLGTLIARPENRRLRRAQVGNDHDEWRRELDVHPCYILTGQQP